MAKLMSVVLMAAVTSATLGVIAQQATPKMKVKSVPIQQTPSASGQQMFVTYCAACHGADARGNGPAAPAMKSPPVDLTTLSQRNGGVFPANHVNSVLRFGVENSAHGSADMPIWGDLLLSLHPTGQDDGTMQVRQRISSLTDYLKKLQK